MDLSLITIETNRLLLVPVSTQHISDIFQEYREPMTKYMNHPTTGTLEELTERHKKWRRQLKAGTRLFMATLLKASGEFIGCFAIDGIGTMDPEMGGWLKKSAHGQRFGQEAAAGLRKWAQTHLTYHHLKWPCAKANIASCKVAEALGGKVEKQYKKTNTSGYTWDFVEYWISRDL